MLAIGFLSLLSVGFAVMSVGGDEAEAEGDAVDIGDIDALSDVLDEFASTRGDVEIEFEPGDDLDPEVEAQINEFVESVEANPDQRIEDVVDDLHAFLDGLEEDASTGSDAAVSDMVETDAAETDLAQAASESSAPPMGDEFRDPLKIAEELDAQRILDEIAAEEARQPENLVTVSDASGAEIGDGLVMQERAADAPETDPAFIVTAPDTANDIDVGYDHEHTFEINYTAETASVSAGLNSVIQGPDGALDRATTTEEDANGVEVEMVTTTKTYEHATQITLNVDAEDIGTHAAQIDLSNPDDILRFEFAGEITGNLHLIQYESEDGREGDSSTTKRAFVVMTSDAVSSLSASDVQTILADEDGQMDGANVLAEIYLGADSVVLNGDPDDGVPYQIRTNNFINDHPLILTNIDWASVGVHDDGAEDPAQTTGTGDPMGGSSDGEQDEINEMLINAGINPGFFGF